jgi:glycerophosphoryl diester phosphodiesterase
MSPNPRSVALILLYGLLSVTARAAEIVAHRGASADAPENTLASFKLGYAQGADADELDIHLSRDGNIVVLHDVDTKRTAGVDRKVVDQTFEELRKLDVGAFGNWQGKGFAEKIPTLDEVLSLVPKGKKLFIEIKCGTEVLPALEQSLRRAKTTPDQTVIITFGYEVAEAAKRRFPDRQVYWLFDYKPDKATGKYPDVDDLIGKAKAARLDGLNLNEKFPLDAATVAKIHAAGLKLYTWTVDDAAKAQNLIRAGADGVTTNRPAALRRELAGSQPATR